MGDTTAIIFWIRRDLRLADHPGLHAASLTGRPVIPVFIHDEVVTALGAAPRWRFGLGVQAFGKALRGIGSDLVLRHGPALDVLADLIAETGAGAVWWARAYDPPSKTRDIGVKASLSARGIDARSFAGHLLFEPWSVATKSGDFYKVYTPFWKNVKERAVPLPLDTVRRLAGPVNWPASDVLGDWGMADGMQRGAAVVAAHVGIGEDVAQQRLARFIESRVAGYAEARNFPAQDGTSRLSENLTHGEISPRVAWHAGQRALHQGDRGAETFLKELVWREFAYHLLHHTPRIATGNWREGWDAFPWNVDETRPEVIAWKQGRTGVQFVDAAMRELHVTGYMHNRARMIVAGYLTKHLMCHWKIGLDWFAQHLVDWDMASNAMGWQWGAGSGPDAAPYFRVFNPESQAEKFDKDHVYRRRWIAEGQNAPPPTALAYFDAVPKRWQLKQTQPYPAPVVTPEVGRMRALEAYRSRDF